MAAKFVDSYVSGTEVDHDDIQNALSWDFAQKSPIVLTEIKAEEWAIIAPTQQSPATVTDLVETMAQIAYKRNIKLGNPITVQIPNSLPESYVSGITEAFEKLQETIKIFVIILRGHGKSRKLAYELAVDRAECAYDLRVVYVPGEHVEGIIEGTSIRQISKLFNRMVRKFKRGTIYDHIPLILPEHKLPQPKPSQMEELQKPVPIGTLELESQEQHMEREKKKKPKNKLAVRLRPAGPPADYEDSFYKNFFANMTFDEPEPTDPGCNITSTSPAVYKNFFKDWEPNIHSEVWNYYSDSD